MTNGKTEENPKVLVGCPVSDYHEYCTKEYLEAIKSLTYTNYDILLVDNSKDDRFYNTIKDKVPVLRTGYHPNVYERVIRSRNALRQRALDGGYDYFLSLEQDVIPPRNVIERLLKYGKKIISGVYFIPEMKNGKARLAPMIWAEHQADPKKKLDIREDIINGKNLIKAGACGLGCVLIHRKVLEQIPFRYNTSEGDGIDDSFFSLDARNKGFEIYADTAIKCLHLIKGRNWYWKDLVKQQD